MDRQLVESFLVALANALIRQSTRIIGIEKTLARGLLWEFIT